MLSIDINCDMGESTALWEYDINKDFSLLPYISSMNLACGFHAGDVHTMHDLVEMGLERGIAIGAHPGFADKENFGRTNVMYPPEKLYDIILYQIGALDAFLKIRGTRLHHVKPHGAMYNMAAQDGVMANTICKAIKEYDPDLILYGLSGSELIRAAQGIGLNTRSEVFADRTYKEDGSLTPRSEPNATIEDVRVSHKQVMQMILQGTVTSVGGKEVEIQAQTICIHSDGSLALDFAMTIFDVLTKNEIRVSSL